MRLYHGTTGSALPEILQDGIRPRPVHGGNWKICPSKLGYVYLTSAYALYFAQSAVSAQAPKDADAATLFYQANPLAVVEIETDRLDAGALCPDEDFIAQQILINRSLGRKFGDPAIDRVKTLRTLTNRLDPSDFRDHWQLSLERLGNCCHEWAIPPEAITRYAILDPTAAGDLIDEAMEPTITIQNYNIIGARYRDLTAFVFGDRPDWIGDNAEYFLNGMTEEAREAAFFGSLSDSDRAAWSERSAARKARMLANRADGVQVVALN